MNPGSRQARALLVIAQFSLALGAAIAFGLAHRQGFEIQSTASVDNHQPAVKGATTTHGLKTPLPQSGGGFDLSRHVIAGGGGTSSNGTYVLDSTIGEPVAGTTSTGGSFSEVGGFLYGPSIDSSTATPTPTPIPTPNPSPSPGITLLQFSTPSYGVDESAGSLQVTVNRIGDITSASVVNYTTSDTAGNKPCNVTNGVASSRCDYLTTVGSLSFAAGDSSKAISIPIIDDVYNEGPEIFTITLSNSINASLGAPSAAVVTINDNDAVNGSNPIDTATFFVRLHYLDFLNREPDPSGLAFWVNEITSCGNDTQCIEVKRINVSAAFFLSIEFQETGYLVYRIYKSAFGNLPGAPVPVRFTEFLQDTQQIGKGVEVGVGDWQTQLEHNKQAFALAFVQRTDFQAGYPDTLTADQFVTKLDTNAGGVLSEIEKANLVTVLGTTPADLSKRAQVLRSVTENSDLRNAEFNKAFVLMQYFGYLRRNPNDPPDADFGGFGFWLNKLNFFGGNFVNAEMVKAFIVSGEYRQRFGP